MKSMDGSIYTDEVLSYYRGFCKLIFDDFFIIIRWPSIVGYEEKISYSCHSGRAHAGGSGGISCLYILLHG